MSRRWDRGRFAPSDEETVGPLANLLDLMLVFACGLIIALVAMSSQLQEYFEVRPEKIERGRELSEMPQIGEQGGSGYVPVGQVYQDPETGKLILLRQ